MPSGAADSITISRELGRHWMPLGQIHLSRRHREIIFGFRGNERSSASMMCVRHRKHAARNNGQYAMACNYCCVMIGDGNWIERGRCTSRSLSLSLYYSVCVVLDGCGDGYTLALCVYCLMVHLRNADDDAATILERWRNCGASLLSVAKFELQSPSLSCTEGIVCERRDASPWQVRGLWSNNRKLVCATGARPNSREKPERWAAFNLFYHDAASKVQDYWEQRAAVTFTDALGMQTHDPGGKVPTDRWMGTFLLVKSCRTVFSGRCRRYWWNGHKVNIVFYWRRAFMSHHQTWLAVNP